ncbi:MAG TPA: alpha/beta fold hydrolase [Blastocatellia bacterium]|nr:alpha/beta fold hydrolase [Blastocatellia bacterium]
MANKRKNEQVMAGAIADSSLEPASRSVKAWLRLAGLVTLGTAGSLTVLLSAAMYPLSGLLVRPRLKRLSQLKSPHLQNFIRKIGVEFEDVVILSFDGTRLYGWWMEAGKESPTVIIFHGVKKNRTDVLRAALVLRRAGMNVLVFDGRAHGSSEGRYVTYGYNERRDAEAALDWLVSEKKIDKDRIGVAGESMGAAIALQVAAHNPGIRAVWADSPFASLRRVAAEFLSRVTHLPNVVVTPVLWTAIQMANYRGKFDVNAINPIELAGRIKCPVTLVHGTADRLIATAHSESIHAVLAGKKEIWFVEGARHARSARYAKREYSKRLVSFFDEHLRGQPAE